mmetsp:Transcript_27435/g.31308  ORF Transcript_27435/g.31308 Transcript_27435/m.31308 type:complete len:203 (-) Transcript_27435:1753-2361(-)|eukprot:CAMPEP_0194186980 /NCGR_PEP_ID=MMETSP0154-20130528/49049_1 /TAXON_ID=1049557 /ORGANISM="Thalassiothrix antarctica, Strain L6-D1" /LENGTH=202 /DNA_ID=CAMNT_0038906395 /DNA_START=175 /DNA_END=783 /DNA_ORIENTATION=+
MPSNYYDIDAILADEQLLTCRSQFDFDHLGPYLDSEITSSHVPKNTKLVLPMWAVSRWLSLGYVQVTVLPPSYSPKFLSNLEADPSHVNLRRKNPYFFLAGRRLVSLLRKQQQQPGRVNNRFQEAANELQNMLLKLYTGSRFRRVLDLAMAGGEDPEDEDNLTTLERHLFRAGASAVAASTEYRYYSKQKPVKKLGKRQRLA